MWVDYNFHVSDVILYNVGAPILSPIFLFTIVDPLGRNNTFYIMWYNVYRIQPISTSSFDVP